jgi:hypothetical protein
MPLDKKSPSEVISYGFSQRIEEAVPEFRF